jgi:hypothetical protein
MHCLLGDAGKGRPVPRHVALLVLLMLPRMYLGPLQLLLLLAVVVLLAALAVLVVEVERVLLLRIVFPCLGSPRVAEVPRTRTMRRRDALVCHLFGDGLHKALIRRQSGNYKVPIRFPLTRLVVRRSPLWAFKILLAGARRVSIGV